MSHKKPAQKKTAFGCHLSTGCAGAFRKLQHIARTSMRNLLAIQHCAIAINGQFIIQRAVERRLLASKRANWAKHFIHCASFYGRAGKSLLKRLNRLFLATCSSSTGSEKSRWIINDLFTAPPPFLKTSPALATNPCDCCQRAVT